MSRRNYGAAQRFTRQRRQDRIGLYDYQARWYDPSLGRFLQPDTIVPEPGNPQSLNRFSYVNNGPLRYKDPSGHYTFEQTPYDTWVFSDARVRSKYWYTHPESVVSQPSNMDVALALTAPLWGALAALGAEVALVDVALPLGEAGITYAGTTLLPAAKEAIQRLGSGAAHLWRMTPFDRGQAVEDFLGRSRELVRNFPVIDRWAGGTATSIKSIDLTAKTYQNAATMVQTVRGYIDTLSTWQGQPTAFGGVTIYPYQIASRVLELAIPPGATQAQMRALQQLQYYAQSLSNPVVLKIIMVN